MRPGEAELPNPATKLSSKGTKAYVNVPVRPETMHVLRRGQVTDPGEVVAAAGEVAALGRADFARSMPPRRSDAFGWRSGSPSPENPLFAAVMVNRLWQHHFGVGLVDTPSDFGFNGGRPSHPELLDWLWHQSS